jgi:SOS-response transcriptional repressor LexA
MPSKNPREFEEIGERLKAWLEGKFGNVHHAAIELGMSPPVLYQYTMGVRKPGNKMQERLRGAKCDVEWLMTGKEPATPAKAQTTFLEVELQKIPVFEYARAGEKSLVLAQEPAYYIGTQKTKDDSRFGVVVKGRSMEPVISEGEVVIVSKKKEVKSGDVCLVVFSDGDACLRRLHFQDNTVTLTSANEKEYPPSIHKKSEITHLYRAVQKLSTIQ